MSQKKPATGEGIINGTILRSPTQPVCRIGEPCSAPAPGVRVSISPIGGGHTFDNVTDSSGAYSVRVPPGSYLIIVQGNGIVQTRNYTQNVNVAADETSTANFTIDTGIR